MVALKMQVDKYKTAYDGDGWQAENVGRLKASNQSTRMNSQREEKLGCTNMPPRRDVGKYWIFNGWTLKARDHRCLYVTPLSSLEHYVHRTVCMCRNVILSTVQSRLNNCSWKSSFKPDRKNFYFAFIPCVHKEVHKPSRLFN